MFIGRTGAQAPIFWSPDAKSQFIGKDPDAGEGRLKVKGVAGGRGCSKCHPERGAVTIRILSQKGLRSPHITYHGWQCWGLPMGRML